MRYRIRDADYFMQYGTKEEETFYVPVGKNISNMTKCFNRDMLKFCGTTVYGKVPIVLGGVKCFTMKDEKRSKNWYFYEGWFDELEESSLELRRNGRGLTGFRLNIIE